MAANAQERVEVPTTYEAGHFYAAPLLANGRAMRLVADTAGAGGGGRYVLARAATDQLGIHVVACKTDGDVENVATPTFQAGHGLPMNAGTPCDAPTMVSSHLVAIDHEDGQLGAGYWPGHVWTFDYPAQKLWLESRRWHPAVDAHRIELGFNHNDQGHPVGGFARIPIRVDGETLPMLMDTGATGHPTTAGKIAYDELNASGIGVTSYITTSQLDRWHKAHPDWRVIDAGDDLLGHPWRLIEVPHVDVGEWSVNAVWFTERSDAAFGEENGGMATYTDGPVSGALGANVYRHFRMTIDYPHGVAYLGCATGCRASTNSVN
jgi:predicted aspartyl protease